MNKSELINAMKEKQDKLINESNEIRAKLSQLNTVKSQLEQRFIEIRGSLNELNDLLKIFNEETEEGEDGNDSKHNIESESDTDKK